MYIQLYTPHTMLDTSSFQPHHDPHRVIALVTGANSGYGLGICHQLLSNLSLPSTVPIPASTPQPTALPPSMRDSIRSNSLQPTKTSVPETTLTLILACRSGAKAQEAIDILWKKHKSDLEKRKKKGLAAKEGWLEGLRIVWEGVNLDSPGGENGILAFTEHVRNRYPHITCLFLNAGMGAFSGIDYWKFAKQIFTDGMSIALSQPQFNIEIKGAKSADGERGLVWGTNVLAPYIMARELLPMLRRSPPGLPFAPRVVYTSSGTATLSKLNNHPLDDYMLLNYDESYGASKYMGDMVMLQLDREFNDENTKRDGDRGVRVLTIEPGCVATNFFNAGLGAWAWWIKFKWFWYWLSFYICRLLGSPYHPVYADQGALPMLYAALIPAAFLLSPSQVPAQKFEVRAQRWGNTKVGYGEIDRWEEADGLGLPKGFAERCEAVRRDWRKREGLE
ncbi:hypothetical protein AYX15_02117 [Cryptococcus neoformans]|nr:hypothetical protein AYX15_02117 [Cryptococcus neoformans var. grubii]